MHRNSDLTDTAYFVTFTRGIVTAFNAHEEPVSLCSL